MAEFWEESFIDKQTMWGFEPADSAIATKDFFIEKNIKEILIPGIGYGRNAKVFAENGIDVTGIEISKTAIDLARESGFNSKIYHGSVAEMPFDNKLYDGIFSYALLHLLDSKERKKFIKDCYSQLKPNRYMIFTTVSKKAPMYGTGEQLGKELFRTNAGVEIFFYDSDSIREDFSQYGLVEISEIDEPNKNGYNSSSINFLMIKCRKEV